VYSVLSLDEKKNLGESIIKFWKELQNSYNRPIKGKSEAIAFLRSVYTKVDMFALVCITDLFEKKDMANETGVIEEVLGLLLKKKKTLKPVKRETYQQLMSEIINKIKKGKKT